MTNRAGLWGLAGNPQSRLPGYAPPSILPAYYDPETGQTSTAPPRASLHLPGVGSPLAPASAPVAVIDRASEADQRLSGLALVVGGVNPGGQTGSFLVDDYRNPRSPLPRQGGAWAPGDPGGYVPWDFYPRLPAVPPWEHGGFVWQGYGADGAEYGLRRDYGGGAATSRVPQP